MGPSVSAIGLRESDKGPGDAAEVQGQLLASRQGHEPDTFVELREAWSGVVKRDGDDGRTAGKSVVDDRGDQCGTET